jgi:hypothetical protein
MDQHPFLADWERFKPMLAWLQVMAMTLVVGFLMTTLNALPLSASATVAAFDGIKSVSTSTIVRHNSTAGDDHLAAASFSMSGTGQTPCDQENAPHDKLGCCIGGHCTAGSALVSPSNPRPSVLETTTVLLHLAVTTLVSVHLGLPLEPPRLSI